MTIALIALYLAALVVANLVITALGTVAVIPVGLVLIGLTLVVRDRLHDRLAGRELVAGMAALLVAGGLVSYALNADAARVALASVVAFTLATVVDAVGYQLLEGRRPWVRSAVSSAPAGLVDSAAFLIVLTGGIPVVLILAQAAAKAAGAAAWARVLYPGRTVEQELRRQARDGVTANAYDGPNGARLYR